jgi:RNA polymerase sigma-70 factor (ECF subfamily)
MGCGTASDPSAALARALARFEGGLRAISARHRLQPAEADELLQEVRLRLWRALRDGERIDTAATSYLYRTATSAALDLVRGRRRRDAVALDDLSVPLPAREVAPDVAITLAEVADRLDAAIRALPASRRGVVRLYFSGYGCTEIAGLLGWTEAKVRNLVHRGAVEVRARLRLLGIHESG